MVEHEQAYQARTRHSFWRGVGWLVTDRQALIQTGACELTIGFMQVRVMPFTSRLARQSYERSTLLEVSGSTPMLAHIWWN